MKKYHIIIILLLLSLAACNDDSSNVRENDFDRGALLVNLADNLIIPSFKDLQSKVNAMETAKNAFLADASAANLEALQATWQEAMRSFQACSPFAFGPADFPLGTFVEVLGTFPVNTTQVETNISDPNFNLAASFNRDVRGFLAVEYLIFDLAGNTEVLNKYGSGSEDRKNYLTTLVTEIKTRVDEIVTAWEGDYRATFVGNTGTSSGSPIALLYNAWIKDYENIKNFKIEIPAGLQAGQTSTEPSKVEAYYSGISKELIKLNFKASEDVWLGRSPEGNDGIGFEEYLLSIEGGEALANQTKPEIVKIHEAIDALPSGRLSDNVSSTTVVNLHSLMQGNTANFKSSMSSLLGISITFASNDGD